MLLIHVPRLTNRLGYTLNVIFKHILRVDFQITADDDLFNSNDGPKFSYGPRKIGDAPFIRSCDLLFETSIEDQSPRPFLYQDTVGLFPVHNQASFFPFDIFAASFYCLSRYEEYMPHFNDAHGRFPAHESLAFKENFLHHAVVDRWAIMIANMIAASYPNFEMPSRIMDIEDTIDIDAAYCYKNKGFFRSIIGITRDLFGSHDTNLVRKRLKVLVRKEPDPFDSFDYIIDVHKQYPNFKFKFFALMSDYNVNDKPISYQNKEFRLLMQHLGDYAKLGLHSSYASFDDPALLAVECERLAELLHRNITRNRAHFLRLALPITYNALIDCGIQHDYSMGFADEPGFRSGTGTPYPFFDLESDCEKPLMIHPFVAMDSTFYYYKKMAPAQAETVYKQLVDEANVVGCTLSLLWHNQSLCEDFGWEGWRQVYQNVLSYADEARKK